MSLSLPHFLVVSALLLAAGIAAILLKRTPLGIWIGIQLILSAAALNFAAFNAYLPPSHSPLAPRTDGQIFTLFIIILATAQSATTLALLLNQYHRKMTNNE